MKSSALGLVAAMAFVAATPALAQDEAWKEFKGKVVVSDEMLAPTFASDELMISTLHRVECSEVASSHGFWRLQLVAFLNKDVDGDTVRVVARDVTATRAQPGRRQVSSGGLLKPRVFEVETQTAQRILRINNLVLSDAMGFEPGHEYQLSVEGDAEMGNRGGEKRDVYARGVITLK